MKKSIVFLLAVLVILPFTSCQKNSTTFSAFSNESTAYISGSETTISSGILESSAPLKPVDYTKVENPPWSNGNFSFSAQTNGKIYFTINAQKLYSYDLKTQKTDLLKTFSDLEMIGGITAIDGRIYGVKSTGIPITQSQSSMEIAPSEFINLVGDESFSPIEIPSTPFYFVTDGKLYYKSDLSYDFVDLTTREKGTLSFKDHEFYIGNVKCDDTYFYFNDVGPSQSFDKLYRVPKQNPTFEKIEEMNLGKSLYLSYVQNDTFYFKDYMSANGQNYYKAKWNQKIDPLSFQGRENSSIPSFYPYQDGFIVNFHNGQKIELSSFDLEGNYIETFEEMNVDDFNTSLGVASYEKDLFYSIEKFREEKNGDYEILPSTAFYIDEQGNKHTIPIE